MTLLEQILFALYPGKPGRLLELGAKCHPQNGPYKARFEFDGWEHVSVDLNGLYGALPVDLTEPLALGEFDVVTNFGTTEHVEGQAQVWENIYHALKIGGWFISTTPAPGQWPGHGKYYPSAEWYRTFCDINDLEIKLIKQIDQGIPARDMVCCVAVKRGNALYSFPDFPIYISEGGKVGAYE